MDGRIHDLKRVLGRHDIRQARRVVTATALALIMVTSTASFAFDKDRQYPYDFQYVTQGVDGEITGDATLAPGETAEFFLDLKNTGTETWKNHGATPFRIGADRPRDHQSALAHSSWIAANRPATFSEKVGEGKGATVEPATEIAPGEIGRFTFTVQTPDKSVSFKEYVQPVLEGRFWLGRNFGIHWRVNVGTYHGSRWVGQSNTAPEVTDGQATVSLAMENTGTSVWQNTGTTPLRLGTYRPMDRQSELHNDSWLAPNRVGSFVGTAQFDGEGELERGGDGLIQYTPADTVSPGETAVFHFAMQAPTEPIDTREYFNLVVERVTWLKDWGVYWPVTTTEPEPTPTPEPEDTTDPTVSLTAPSDGATVSGTVSVSADASDDVGVAGVQFKLDGSDLGSEDTTDPYGISWDTTTVTDGPHTITAVARDAAGNTATSTGHTVTVDNAAPSGDLYVSTGGSDANPCTEAEPCATIDAAWDQCSPGDSIIILAGTYGAQSITGDKAAPGCTATAEDGTVIGTLQTNGAYFTLENVTVDVGSAHNTGWGGGGNNVTLRDVKLHGPFVTAYITGDNVTWEGGEFGIAGQTGGQRDFCGVDGQPITLDGANDVTFNDIDFHPQATISNTSCNHMEYIRIDQGGSNFTLRNSTFDSGDGSNTATIFVTNPSGGVTYSGLKLENNFFGNNAASSGALQVHDNIDTCSGWTFAYNTYRAYPGAWTCSTPSNLWVGNLGPYASSSPCSGTHTENVWQHNIAGSCGTDTWVIGPAFEVSELGLGGSDGFHLQEGSPAIDAAETGGYCTSTLGSRDHDDNVRPVGAACDAGAHEYSATLQVSTSGSDANPCTQAQPCLSLNRAYQVANPGDTVSVATGSYASQTINKDAGKSLGSTKVVLRADGDVVLGGFNSYANDIHYIGFELPRPSGTATLKGGRNVIMEDFRAAKPYIIGPTSSSSTADTIDSITIKGGDFGPHVSCGGGFGINTLGGRPANNITLEGITMHDFSIDASCPDAHLDCLHTFNGIDGLTVRNSRFYNCEHFGALVNGSSNVTIENNFFEGGIHGFKLRGDNDPSIEVFNTVLIRNNSADHINLGSGGSNTLNDVRVEGNATVDTPTCRSGVTYTGNLSESGRCSTDNDFSPESIGFADVANGDFHVTDTSPAVDRLSSGPATDIDGDSRPQGSLFDVGADEVTGTSPSGLDGATAQASQTGTIPWWMYVLGLILLAFGLVGPVAFVGHPKK